MNKKKINRNNIITIIFVFGFIIVMMVYMFSSSNKKQIEVEKGLNTVFSKISFEGDIIGLNKIERGGRTRVVICVDLAYTNTDYFYLFDDYFCFRIENNIASFPVGYMTDEKDPFTNFLLKAKYIKVNIDNNNQMIFLDDEGNEMIEKLYYRNNNLRESDINFCFIKK